MATVSLPPARTHRNEVPAGCPLTISEFAVMEALIGGESYAQYARRTRRSIATVKTQASTAFQRLGVSDITQAVLHCLRARWIALDGVQMRPRARDEDFDVTPAQRLYLAVFDLHVKVRSDEAKLVTRAMMDELLPAMCGEVHINARGCGIPAGKRARRDLIRLLIEDHRRRRD